MEVGAAKFIPGGMIKFGQYDNGEIAIQIAALDGSGEMEGTATVNMVPSGAPAAGPDAVWLKGWTENEGIPEALVAAGVVEPPIAVFPAGNSMAQMARLTPMAKAEMVVQSQTEAQRVARESGGSQIKF